MKYGLAAEMTRFHGIVTKYEAVITWTLCLWAALTEVLSICSELRFYYHQMNEKQLNSAERTKHIDDAGTVVIEHLASSHRSAFNVLKTWWKVRSMFLSFNISSLSFFIYLVILLHSYHRLWRVSRQTHTNSPPQFSSLLSAPTKEKDPTGLVPPTSLACNRKPWNGTESALRDTGNTNPSLISSED